MKILIDIGHPGHVHYFKNLIFMLKNNGHEIKVTARDKEVVLELLKYYKISYENRGKGQDSKLGKFMYMLKADIQLLTISLKFKPDIFLSFSSPYAAQVSKILSRPHITLNDTEHTDKTHSIFTYPFSSSILTPASYKNHLGKKHIRFNSIMEGTYLHPTYFKPDPDIKKTLQLKNNEDYVVLRFVSWNAHHDYGQQGLDLETKKKIIQLFKSKKYKIFISSEKELPNEFKPYQLNISPHKMHDVLASANLFIGESGTMASECALLGTTVIYVNSLPLMCYLDLAKKADILKHFNSSEGVVEYAENLIKDSNLKKKTKEKTKIMTQEFIDPTDFLYQHIIDHQINSKLRT